MAGADYSVFTDISVLVDYCCIYSETHQKAKELLDKIHRDSGRIVISKTAGETLRERLINRQEMFEYLFHESSRCIKEYGQSAAVFKGQVLNRENLQSELSLGINSNYDISQLRAYLDSVGIQEFRKNVDDFAHQGHYFQKRLENGMIYDRFDRGGRDLFHVKLVLQSHCNDDAQVESMLDAVSWAIDNRGGSILIRSTDPLYQEIEQLSDSLPMGSNPDFKSPTSALESAKQ